MNKISRTLGLIGVFSATMLAFPSGASATRTPAADLASLGTASGDRSESSSLTAEVNAAERNEEGNILSVTWSVENNGDSDEVLTWLHEGSYFYGGSFFSGVAASSTETGTRYHAFMDGAGNCVCSGNINTDFINVIYPGKKYTYWSLYSISNEVDSVTVEIPGFEPIEDIPIS